VSDKHRRLDQIAESKPEFGAVVDVWGGFAASNGDPSGMDPGEAPIFLLHGDKDQRVPVSWSHAIAARAKELEIPHELHIFDGGHGLSIELMYDTPDAEGLTYLDRKVRFVINALTPPPPPKLTPPDPPKSAITATVTPNGRKIKVDVDPDWEKGHYFVKVQRKTKGKWQHEVRVRTSGASDRAKYPLRKGKYRAVVPAGRNGIAKVVSGTVRITKNAEPRSGVVLAKARKGRLHIKVNPNWKADYYIVKVKKKVRGRWATRRTERTRGLGDRVVVNIPKGRYRVVAPAGQNQVGRMVSRPVKLRR
jgi:hypothetical protein